MTKDQAFNLINEFGGSGEYKMIDLIKLVLAAAALEREECARVADNEAEGWRMESRGPEDGYAHGRSRMAATLAKTIRARGNK